MVLALIAAFARPAVAEPTTIDHVTIVDVADGTRIQDQSVSFDGDRIAAIGPSPVPGAGRRIDGTGLFLLPGLWDMHVHSHRERRWAYHYPLFRAFGITGVREGGTHLGSALALRNQAEANPLAPRVIWGTPISTALRKLTASACPPRTKRAAGSLSGNCTGSVSTSLRSMTA